MDSREIELAETFAEVARSLLTERDATMTLRRIVSAAVQVVEGCEHAGIELVEKRVVTAVAPSSETAASIAALQSELDEGPCLSAIRNHEMYQVDDLAGEDRWPTFSRRAHAKTGISSILGFRLYADHDTFGALDLYSTQRHAFDATAVAAGAVLAAHAGVAMASAQERKGLEAAVATRDIIGQAKGILMATSHVDADEAFEILRSASQRMNVKLREVAAQVVHSVEEGDRASEQSAS